MADLNIDTTQYERTAPTGGSPLPPGVYSMTVVRAALKETKGGGVMEKIEFDITSPAEFSNRKFWDTFNIINNGPKKAATEKFAKERISELGRAAGIMGNLTEEALLGKSVQGRLIVKPSTNPAYPNPKNECEEYYAIGANPAQAKSMQMQTAQVAAPAAKPNWNSAGQAPAPAQAAPAPAKAPWK